MAVNMNAELELELAKQTISEGGSLLLYGDYCQSLKILENLFNYFSQGNQFLCSMHDSSKIEKPLDLFEPILRLKYKNPNKLIGLYSTLGHIDHIAEVCGMDLYGKTENERKMPLIFIKGIDELFFKFDFPENQKESGTFGAGLRKLHQADRAIFCGNIRNTDSLAYKKTIGTGSYLFYQGNFATLEISD
jgi:hypothetical protein